MKSSARDAGASSIGPLELADRVGITVVLVAATIAVTAWLATRIYSAGVLMYGQRPSIRRMLAAIRTGS